eukprot:TRINITY_DN14178_c0_g1_i3.p1 TRINITY_DN14178_c0_g1~~TRINITY_DN14178_c0_g1_i3.p1  ORF type:complete len:530 (-),score=88.89 TRINITY_DN14178_c0_g1_i3:182-1771(-)
MAVVPRYVVVIVASLIVISYMFVLSYRQCLFPLSSSSSSTNSTTPSSSSSIITVSDYYKHKASFQKDHHHDHPLTFGGVTRRTLIVWSMHEPSRAMFHSLSERLRSMYTYDDVIEVTPNMLLDALLDALSRSRVIIYPVLSSSSSTPKHTNAASAAEDGIFSSTDILFESAMKKGTELIDVHIQTPSSSSSSPVNPVNMDEILDRVRIASIVNRPKVLVISLPRSGSSFMGELFKQNVAFKYLYEPSHFSWPQSDPCSWTEHHLEEKKEAAQLMRDMYEKCSIRGISAYQQGDENQFWPPHPDFYWTKDFDALEDNCHNTVMAVKEVGMWWSKVRWLHSVLGPHSKIIYLVRDPRNWVSSWLKLNTLNNMTFYEEWGYSQNSFMETCDGVPLSDEFKRLSSTLDDKTQPPHLRLAARWQAVNAKIFEDILTLPHENRLIVHLEELLTNPQPYVKAMYEFIGMPLPARVVDWVDKNTQGGNENIRYSTSRNSTQMASIWSSRLSPDQVHDIEEITLPLLGKLDETAVRVN